MNKNSRKVQVKEIENHLRHYKAYKAGIRNLQKQIEWIMPSVTAQYSASEGSCGTFNISSKVEQAVLDRLEGKRALDLHEEMARFQLIIDSIDRATEELNETEKGFITYRYYELMPVPVVAEKLGYHEKYLNKFRNRLMEKLLISLSNILKLG